MEGGTASIRGGNIAPGEEVAGVAPWPDPGEGLVFVAGGVVLAASSHVGRSIRIDRAPADVFAMFNLHGRYNGWSPWFQLDPGALRLFGPTLGSGRKDELRERGARGGP